MSWSEAVAVAGLIGTGSLFILNLKMSATVSGLELEMEKLRGEMRKEAADHYKQVMLSVASIVESLTRTFANREAADAKHNANLQRLDSIEGILRDLNTRVQDIG